jgi:hypothetical protein
MTTSVNTYVEAEHISLEVVLDDPETWVADFTDWCDDLPPAGAFCVRCVGEEGTGGRIEPLVVVCVGSDFRSPYALGMTLDCAERLVCAKSHDEGLSLLADKLREQTAAAREHKRQLMGH